MGEADAGRTVWGVADNLEKTLLCNFFIFVGNFFKTRYLQLYVKYNIES